MATPTRMMPVTEERERSSSFLDTIELSKLQAADRYMPTLSVKQFGDRQAQLEQLRGMLIECVDYGAIEGKDKPVLMKPGAEKICAFFGYAPSFELVRVIEEWDATGPHGEMLFYYNYRCILKKSGEAVGEGIGSANSWESKYRYRWIDAAQAESLYSAEQLRKAVVRSSSIFEPDFAISKAETTGKYGKPAAYWQQFENAIADKTAVRTSRETKTGRPMDGWTIGGKQYRVPNPDVADVVNTVDKMAQKRAYIASTLSATGASQFFSQDLEPGEAGQPETSDQVATRRIAEEQAKQQTSQTAKQPASQPAAAKQSQPAPAVAVVGRMVKYQLKDLTKAASLTAAENAVFSRLCHVLGGNEANANHLWQQALERHDIPANGPVPAVRMMDCLNEFIDKINELETEGATNAG